MRVVPPIPAYSLGRRTALAWIVAALLLLPSLAGRSGDLIQDLDRVLDPDEEMGWKSGVAMLAELKLRPRRSAKILIRRLEDDTLTEEQLSVTLWALMVTKDRRAIEPVLDLYLSRDPRIEPLMCMYVLTQVVDRRAAPRLLDAFRAETDPERRFGLLNLLAQIQCEEALPYMGEFLEQDSPEYPWQSYCLFGQMGDKGIPFLLARIDHPDPIVRANTVRVLGDWLAAPEVEGLLRERYAAESDATVRGAIVLSLGRMIGDWFETRAFLERVAAEAEQEELAELAREALSGMDALHKDLTTLTRMKRVSPDAFRSEYGRAFDKAEMDYTRYWDLRISSSLEDERALKKLRARIMFRQSDVSFEDYRLTTDIIIQNRLLAQPPWLYWEPWGEVAAERSRPPGVEDGGFGLPAEPDGEP